MNTKKLKIFATDARLILIEGVTRKLQYWGFNEKGECTQEMEKIPGGYEFREQVFNDERIYPKWQNLKRHIRDAQTWKDIIEQAAYTWFNRLIAIKILEMNGYQQEALAFREETKVPMLLQNAKRGSITPHFNADQELLRHYIAEDDDEKALALLLADHCNRHDLLRDIFGGIDDFTELLLPDNLLVEEGIVSLINDEQAIDAEDFKEVELIGWLYQFYISDRKNEVFAGFKKNQKARAEDIPAATQIFTPKWIVKYMVENTVGKLYLDYDPLSAIKGDMKYLVENSDGAGSEEKEKALINDLKELTLLDPACGSGHILVVGFELLMKMYLEQGYSKKQAVENILANNIFGLDIDDRAAQLARFAMMMKAAEYESSILNKGQHVHIYAFPEEAHFTNEELLIFLEGENQYLSELKEALGLLNKGKNIGSALKLELSEEALVYIAKQYNDWQKRDETAALGLAEQSTWNKIKPFLQVAHVLEKKYTAVVANPPYMGQKSMNWDLKDYVNSHYPLSKSDLFAVFMEVCLRMSCRSGFMGMINQHSWMFLSSYHKLREEIIKSYGITSMLHLGPRTFEELSGEVVQSTAFVIKKAKENTYGTYYRLVDYRSNAKKESHFLKGNDRYLNISQIDFSKIPGSPIAYWVSEREKDLYNNGSYFQSKCKPRKGIDTGENACFLRFWHEVNQNKISHKTLDLTKKWFPYNKGGEFRKWYGNRDNIINWENGGEEVKSRLSWRSKKPTIRNSQFHFKEGFTWTTVSSIGFSSRYVPPGCLFDNGGCTLFSDEELYYFGAMLNTKVASRYLEFLSPTLNFQPGDIGRMLYYKSNGRYNAIQSITTELIELAKIDWDSHETSWDFDASPLCNESNSLSRSFIFLQEKFTKEFFKQHTNEEELNRIFIDIYGLQEELTPEVSLKDITILQEELDRNALDKLELTFRKHGEEAIELPINKDEVMRQFISYAVGCMMGRYRLDKPGLNIAHPNPAEEELGTYFYRDRKWSIDEDAILPIMGSDSPFADDITHRTKEFIRVVWGDETLTENLNFLQECLGMDLEKFLVNKFWDYHKSMYKKRPIYWLFSSKKGTFQILTYLHRMDKYTVQKIRQNYLHKYQSWLSEQIDKMAANEASLSRQEQKKLDDYRKAQVECKEYDEVLKELAKEQIEFDLDDGVVVNYAKFGEAVRKI